MKSATGWDRPSSPYHAGEQALQERLGRKDQQEAIARQIHRPYMLDQHRDFFAQLPFLLVGSVDKAGWPWASMVFGQSGFVSAPTGKRLNISNAPLAGDPLAENLMLGAPLGLLGIELSTRRRNRMNGVVSEVGSSGCTVDVVQSYGNCPQYIQTRATQFARDPDTSFAAESERFTTLDDNARHLIEAADTFFVASHNDRDDPRDTGGVDVSHRGGQPGFVKVEGDTLTVPDYLGNFAFNTLGNFLVNPKAGLLFVDFDSGELLMLTGKVELVWDRTPEIDAFQGAERAWRFHLDHGVRLRDASPLRWAFGEASPNSLLTGTWADAEKQLASKEHHTRWLPYRVARITKESASIRSFYLEPAHEFGRFPHQPGQYLTIRVTPPDADAPAVRTYTLSSAPSDPLYRISVKREGIVSQQLHDAIRPGDMIEARAPLGSFTLDTKAQRPAVLLAGGVGITPMIAMARQAVSNGVSHRHIRPLTIIHAARSIEERAFADEFNQLVQTGAGALRYVSAITHPEPGAQAGKHYHLDGRVDADMLRRILPLDNYDFLLCGPPGFMQSLYDLLRHLGVRDDRILAEAFGPASLKRRPDGNAIEATNTNGVGDKATVSFARTGTKHDWASDDGTLLDFAEHHGLAPAFGCRSGRCGNCAVRLLAGKVAYLFPPEVKLPDKEALICCAVPAAGSQSIELDL